MLICYPLAGYFIFFIYLEITKVEELALNSTQELSVFDIHPSGLAYAMPTVVPVIAYMATSLKFWFLDEGDCHQQDLWKVIKREDKKL